MCPLSVPPAAFSGSARAQPANAERANLPSGDASLPGGVGWRSVPISARSRQGLPPWREEASDQLTATTPANKDEDLLCYSPRLRRCRWPDSNRHGPITAQRILSPLRLPFRHIGALPFTRANLRYPLLIQLRLCYTLCYISEH